jgi:WXXGXW repeat (2 copies)
MVIKRLIGLVFAGALAFSAAAADIVVRIAPPRVRVERRPPPPGRNYVWVSGYHRWEGNTYVWTPGRWEQPPRPRARWVAHHWVHRRGGWVFVEGHWR